MYLPQHVQSVRKHFGDGTVYMNCRREDANRSFASWSNTGMLQRGCKVASLHEEIAETADNWNNRPYQLEFQQLEVTTTGVVRNSQK